MTVHKFKTVLVETLFLFHVIDKCSDCFLYIVQDLNHIQRQCYICIAIYIRKVKFSLRSTSESVKPLSIISEGTLEREQ